MTLAFFWFSKTLVILFLERTVASATGSYPDEEGKALSLFTFTLTFEGVFRIRPCVVARGCMSEMMKAPYQFITKINWRRTIRYGCLSSATFPP